MEVASTAAASAQSKSDSSRATLASDFDTFLLLLTTQLQSQDPLSPMDAEKFTEQLVQFSAVEQAVQTNSKLEEMVGLLQIGQTTAALQFLGSKVELDPDRLYLAGEEPAVITYSLPEAAASVDIKILNDNGDLVRELDGETLAGTNRVEWDGLTDFGRRAAVGSYILAVSAVDHRGLGLDVETPATGTVDGVRSTDAGPLLMVDGVPTAMTSIRSIFR